MSMQEMENKKDSIIAMKEAEITEWKQKMDEMAHEFSQMLKVRWTHHELIIVFLVNPFNWSLKCNSKRLIRWVNASLYQTTSGIQITKVVITQHQVNCSENSRAFPLESTK